MVLICTRWRVNRCIYIERYVTSPDPCSPEQLHYHMQTHSFTSLHTPPPRPFTISIYEQHRRAEVKGLGARATVVRRRDLGVIVKIFEVTTRRQKRGRQGKGEGRNQWLARCMSHRFVRFLRRDRARDHRSHRATRGIELSEQPRPSHPRP